MLKEAVRTRRLSKNSQANQMTKVVRNTQITREFRITKKEYGVGEYDEAEAAKESKRQLKAYKQEKGLP